MTLPVEQQALQHVRAAQERGIVRAGAADHDMGAAACSGMAAVDHELVGAEPAGARVVIDSRGDGHRLAPVAGRLDIHLDHSRVRRHLEHGQAGVVRGRIAFDPDRRAFRRCVQMGHKLQVVLQPGERGHEDIEPVAPGLHRQGRPHNRRFAPAPRRVRAPGGRNAALAVDLVERRQLAPRLIGIDGCDVGIVLGRDDRELVERQAKADRRIARRQKEAFTPEAPGLAQPGAAFGPGGGAPDRQDVADRL